MKKKILLLCTMVMLVFSCTGISALAKSSKTTALTVSCDQLYMKVGQTRTIGVIVEPSNSTSSIKFSSSKPSVATINKSGKVKAKKAGITVITVKSGSCKKKIQVNVLKKGVKVTKLKFDKKKLTVEAGTEQFLSYSVKKAKATTKIKWTSSNSKVVSVTQTGKIKAKKKGTATITISANGKKATCTIKVVNSKTGTSSESSSSSGSGSSGSSSSGSGTSNNSSSGKQDLSKLNLTVEVVYERNYSSSYTYNGQAIEPLVKVYNDELYLYKDVDYSLSYSNNINAGTATITIKGMGSYTGSIKTTFLINKRTQDVSVSLPINKLYVGETAQISVNAVGDLEFTTTKDGVVKIDSNGLITAIGTGSTEIYMTASGDDNYYEYGRRYVGYLTVTQKEPTAYGFSVNGWNSKSTYKVNNVNSVTSSGGNEYTVYFRCDADEDWLDNNVTFEAEDVTPTSYKEMFTAMGVSCSSPSVSTESSSTNGTVQEPFTADGPGNYNVQAMSEEKLTITAGEGVRAVKVYAKSDEKTLDYIYLVSNGKDSSGEYSEYDKKLYKDVRAKVEAKLWDSGMTNLEKIEVLATYINETTHYPDSPATSKEYNPTFWSRWSVDDTALFFDMSNDSNLNAIMKLQGGITDCTAVNLLSTVAQEDLGLPYLYDGSDVADGEGVWVVTGSYSSNPSNPYHYSLKYKYSDETTVLIDAQGMGYGSTSNASCEEHGCQEKIISLK